MAIFRDIPKLFKQTAKKGEMHFIPCFQPMTGSMAETYDCFISLVGEYREETCTA